MRPIISAISADTDISVKPKYQPDILARPTYLSLSNYVSFKFCDFSRYLILAAHVLYIMNCNHKH